MKKPFTTKVPRHQGAPSVLELVFVLLGVLCGLPAFAVQIEGGRPLSRVEDVLVEQTGGAATQAPVMLHGAVTSVEVEQAVVVVNGMRLGMAGVPLHGPYGAMTIRDLQPGNQVRVALGGAPNRRVVLEMWVVP